MRALVLGGAGFLGRHVAMRLHAAGWRVRVLDRSWPQRAAALPAGVEGIAADLMDDATVARALEGTDVVFYAAGSTDLWDLERTAPAIDAARRATARIVHRIAAAGVRRIVYVSSGGTVYGEAGSIPIPEGQPPRPISAHGRLCLAVERALGAAGEAGVILRVANAYGPGQRTDRAQGLIAIACERLASGAVVDVFGSGTAVRDFVHVRDVADAALRAAEYGGHERVFNVGTGRGTSVHALLRLLAERLHVTLRVRELPSRPFDVATNVLDVTRARHELGWAPLVTIEAGLAALVGRAPELGS